MTPRGYHAKLARLERAISPFGQCPRCAGRPTHLMCDRREREGEGGTEVELPLPPEALPCESCGWGPEVTEVITVVIHNRDELERFRHLHPETSAA